MFKEALERRVDREVGKHIAKLKRGLDKEQFLDRVQALGPVVVSIFEALGDSLESRSHRFKTQQKRMLDPDNGYQLEYTWYLNRHFRFLPRVQPVIAIGYRYRENQVAIAINPYLAALEEQDIYAVWSRLADDFDIDAKITNLDRIHMRAGAKYQIDW